MSDADGTWYDKAAGPLVRPYVLSAGRTRPAGYHLELITIVAATAERVDPTLSPEHATIVRICQEPMSVAEVAATVDLPLMLVKVMLGDLIERGHVTFRSPRDLTEIRKPELLQAVLDGLRAL